MKYLFFLVLLANIVFFLWEINTGVDVSVNGREVFRADRGKLILLLSEVGSVLGLATDESTNPEQQQPQDEAVAFEENVEEAPGLEQERIREEFAEASEKETEAEAIESLQKVPGVDKEEILATQIIEIPENEPLSGSEEDSGMEPNDELGIVKEGETENQVGAENQIVHYFEQNENKLPEQNSKQPGCYEFGPFADEAALQQWKQQLDGQVDIVETINRDIEEVQDYLVYYPAAETFEKSQENVKWLRELGINDFWLFLKGDLRGAISLGLYMTEPLAERAQERYREDGLDVQIMPRRQSLQRYFVRLELDKQQKEAVLQLTSEINNRELSVCFGSQ